MDAMAITEHGHIASGMGFYLEAVKPEMGIKPIFGIEAYVVDDAKIKTKEMKSSHLVLIARTDEGFKNLLKLSNISWNENFYYKAKIDWKNLKEHKKGITALTACMGGVVSNAIRFDGYNKARDRVLQLKKIFGEHLFLEMQLMEEVYGWDLERLIRKIKNGKDENIVKERLEYLEQNKADYVELLKRHTSSIKIQPDFQEKMKKLLDNNWVDQATVNKYMYALSKETDTKYILTGDCHYPLKGDHKLQDLIIRVGFGNYKKARQGEDEKSQSSGRGYYSSQLYVKNNKDFDESRKKWHPYMPRSVLVKAIEATHEVADQVNTVIPIGQHQLPEFPIKTHPMYREGDTKEKLFERLIERGFKKIVIPRIETKDIQSYRERIQFEIQTINQAHFVDYFLIIEDIVRNSRKMGIHCIARGSVAGSLVAYALDITNIDPIPYHLLFERFLNPTRVSGERAKAADALPDVDLDFERFGRSRIKKYITDKYGSDKVLSIGSYGTMGIRALIKDFSRALDYKIGQNTYDYTAINKITSAVDPTAKTLEECCESSEDFAKFYEENKGWFETYIRPLIGSIRSFSRHAAGVLITPTPFTDWVPVRTQTIEDEDENEGKIVISQWEDVYCERRGLLKLDILGVKQLDVFHRCIDLIKKNHDIDIVLDDIDITDKNVYKRFHAGENFGVFQFNSGLQSAYMKKMRPNNIEDLCASNALLRPGPMMEGAHDAFIDLKSGKAKPEYDHPCVVPYLGPTFGLMIYQEQTMQVAHALGGLSLAEADMMRSAIKKKDEKLMNPFKEKFIKGCIDKGLKEKHGEKVWHKILAFSAYGFNKSHAATYALQGYYCQWLKTYFPNEFYAATMDFASDDAKKNENIYTHRNHAIDEGIKIFNPHINKSTLKFDVSKKGSIYWPLRAIKGVGEKASTVIQKFQPFTSFEDFFERIEKRNVNKRVMDKLIAADAFRDFGKPEEILRKYYKLRKDPYPEDKENLTEVNWKKLKDETLGYISQSYKTVFKKNFSKHMMTKEMFDNARMDSRVCIGGIITSYREHKARNGTMCFLKIEDLGEKHDVVIFASVFETCKVKPYRGFIVEIRGNKSKSPRGELQIVVGNPSSDKVFIISK
jgi:DNA polymerase-3 subunit alpha